MSNFLSLRLVALFFILNPYLGFPYLIPSDIQPISFVLCLFFARPLKGAANAVFYILSGFAFLGFPLMIFHLISSTSGIDLTSSIRDFFPILAPPVYFSAGVYLLSTRTVVSDLKKSIDLFLILYFFGAFLNIIGLSDFISLFVGRAVFSGFGARGFTSFFPEPSRISEQVLLIVYLLFFLRIPLERIKLLLLALCTVVAGSGQTLIVYFQLFSSFLISYGSLVVSKVFSRFTSLKFNLRLLLSSSTVAITILLFWLTNSQSRGFRAISKIFSLGPAYIASDLGIQIKLSGLSATYASTREFSPFFYFPLLSYESRDLFLEHYKIFYYQFFGITNPPLIPSIYASFGQYPIYFGALGFFFLILFLALAFISGLKSRHFTDKRRFFFLFSLLLTFSFLKVPASNPSTWIMLACFFTTNCNDTEEQANLANK